MNTPEPTSEVKTAADRDKELQKAIKVKKVQGRTTTWFVECSDCKLSSEIKHPAKGMSLRQTARAVAQTHYERHT